MMDDFDSKKLIGVVIMLMVISIMLPIIIAVQNSVVNGITTEYVNVYVDREVGMNNITIGSNFTNKINVKQSQQMQSNITDSKINNSDTILTYQSYTNTSFDINMNISNIQLNDSLYSSDYIINDPNNSHTQDNNYVAGSTTYLFSSFTITENNPILQNITVYGQCFSGDTITFDIYNATTLESNLIPDTFLDTLDTFLVSSSSKQFVTITDCNLTLDNSNTYNNSFFLMLKTSDFGMFWNFDSSLSNSVDYLYDVFDEIFTILPSVDFNVNYTYQYSDILENITINDYLIEEFQNSYTISNITLLQSNITITFNFNIENIVFDYSIAITLYSEYTNTTIGNISINQILLYSNTTKLIAFTSNNTNTQIFTIANQTFSKLILFSNATNRYIDVTLSTPVVLGVNQTYNIKIRDIEVFNDSFKLEFDVYENAVLKNSYNATTATFYPVYAF